ncbi:RNA-binding Raly-like protein isoform X5 [Latimeria chalumnae]|uniref:RNA-binding Raly-like protein isoform X5 n=1 Tax=Latimeria chalumnae TaxID=7897 RepID=UPI0003C13432|nr:PREDICTED: RNA-binding Raly-like protein isoform X5 [Latimeria chalumnae]|eukprot:XP_006001232.1 PREDICTED: RNA-binding Raly-like protein isoform X5 [Latimeria chalumnae]
MTLYKNEHHSQRHINMDGESKPSRPRPGEKRSATNLYGIYDNPRVLHPTRPAPPVKAPRITDEAAKRSKGSVSGSKPKSKADDLQTIKKELTQIKTQIDGLLESLDMMERKRKTQTGTRKESEERTAQSPENSAARDHEDRTEKEEGETEGEDTLENNTDDSDTEMNNQISEGEGSY